MIITPTLKTKSSQKKLVFVMMLVCAQPIISFGQCKGVILESVNVSEVSRPCGSTPTGSIAIDIKGGLAPYSLTWNVNGQESSDLPSVANTNHLLISNRIAAFASGYSLLVKDACGNQMRSDTLELRNTPPIQFVGSPFVSQPNLKNGELNGSILVELIGGLSPRTLILTDSEGKLYKQQFPVGPSEKGKFKYELRNLPPGSYQIEIKSAAQNCTQIWKEKTIIKGFEK